ncbi:MAG: Uncharacterised protein [SAR116 cluster bacterium MED-G04]|jgi:hypothetical protein|nr:hypothetical protein [SAR116 cluster bacterium]CAI8414230.1 MAG: Uncharacterised protein [SAR116 cluster bacterium MED-G04]|tara:strand:- start:613 stop:1401 length:789 start_codon:yes stop_codon:yes gene_type:complete
MLKQLFSLSLMIGLAFPAFAKHDTVSHRAIYDLKINKSLSSAAVKSIIGRTVFTMQRHCDGWQTIEDYAIAFGLEQGQTSFISHYETWEAMNGSAFSFTVHENDSANDFNHFSGFAHSNDGVTEAYFINGEDKTVTLPEGTVFPMRHMQSLLQSARDGEKFQHAVVFLGGDEEDAFYQVSSVIGNRQLTDDSTINFGQLSEDGYWPMRLAYFTPGALESEPEYEIEFDMQDNGVIRSYLVDYGDFSMRGSLKNIVPLLEPDC